MNLDEQCIEARVGERFFIVLSSNPTTGYRWEAIYEDGMLELLGEEYERSSDRIGAGGHQTFTFMPLSSGETVVHLRYRRPWLKVIHEEKEFKISISDPMAGSCDPTGSSNGNIPPSSELL